jgi:cobalt-precorrin-5B (C1)-methyltransferase
VRVASRGTGITFRAGPGVGTITRPGLALPPGEPAINPVPRAMIRAALAEAARQVGGPADVEVELAVPGGEKLAERTLNGRLGIVGGLSILGTTGIVVPYSCAAWIDTIHRGIDVARAMGLTHVAGATGSTSEAAVQAHYGLPDPALIDMGDFVGGMLKYLKRHPVARVSVAGGVAKISKLGQGLLDLHSKRGEVDRDWLGDQARAAGAGAGQAGLIQDANTIAQIFDEMTQSGIHLGAQVAASAWRTAARALGPGMVLDIMIVDRGGAIVAQAPPRMT